MSRKYITFKTHHQKGNKFVYVEVAVCGAAADSYFNIHK